MGASRRPVDFEIRLSRKDGRTGFDCQKRVTCDFIEISGGASNVIGRHQLNCTSKPSTGQMPPSFDLQFAS